MLLMAVIPVCMAMSTRTSSKNTFEQSKSLVKQGCVQSETAALSSTPNQLPDSYVSIGPMQQGSVEVFMSFAIRNASELLEFIANSQRQPKGKGAVLDATQFEEGYAPSITDYQGVATSVEAENLSITQTWPNRLLLAATGSVSNVENAFHVTIDLYQYQNITFYKSVGSVPVPAGLSAAGVQGIEINSFPIQPFIAGASNPDPFSIASNRSPTDLRTAYGTYYPIQNGWTGSGYTIGIVDAYGDSSIATDVSNFDSLYGLPSLTLTTAGTGGSTTSNWPLETALDVEWAHAMAPGAAIRLQLSPDTSGGNLFGAVNTLVGLANPPNVISLSWGGPESILDPILYSGIFSTAASEGINVYVATGDNGAYNGGSSLSINYPASDPNVIAVGGTVPFYNTVQGTNEYYEYGWSDSGGGYSGLFAEPSYQSSAGIPDPSNSRAIPDVSLESYPGVDVYLNSGLYSGVYGTSLSAPLMAGIDAVGLKGGWSLNDNLLYSMYTSTSKYNIAFHDVYLDCYPGSNNGYYYAQYGWDPVTGLGSINFFNFANIYSVSGGVTITSESLSPSIISPGQTFTLTYTIDNPNPTYSLIQIGLGASIRLDGSTNAISDTSNDIYLTFLPGGVSTQTRQFTTSPSLTLGSYDVLWGIWMGPPGQGNYLYYTGWLSNQLQVRPPPPVLSNGYVTPGSGDTYTVFGYYVTYYDSYGNAPTQKQVCIDGTAWYNMGLFSGSPSNGVYSCLLTLAAGNHNYYFQFSDGVNSPVNLPASGTYSGPTVAQWDFTLTPSPSSRTVTAGASTAYSIAVTLSSGSSLQSVSLSCSPSISGVSYSFSPSSGNPTFSSTLTVQTSSSTPANTYTLTITGNGGGQIHTTTVQLIVNPTLSVSILPSSAVMDAGQSQLFNSVITGGTLPYTYLWYLNGSAVSGAVNPSWTLTPSSAGSNSVYLEVTDSVGAVGISNTANILVNAVPTVSISPTSLIMDVGQFQAFNSSVSYGTPAYSYQWCINGTQFSGATTASWNFTPSSAGSWMVYLNITDSVGIIAMSNTVSVTANPLPSVIVSPTSATLTVGQPLNFNSSVSGGTPSYSYQWCLNGSAVSGATGSTWTFNQSSANSYWVCLNVTDNVGATATSNTANVTVTTMFSVYISPTSATLDVNQSLPLTSAVSGGSPPYSYQWYLDDVAISSANESTWTLMPNSSGSYNVYVNVTDETGSQTKSNVVNVTVNPTLTVSISPSSVALNLGQSQVFNSSAANGTFPYSYQWYLNSTLVSGANSSSWAFTPASTGTYEVYVQVSDTVGGQAISNSSIVTVQSVPSYLVVRGLDNRTYYTIYQTSSNSWSSWYALPGATCDSPAAVMFQGQLCIVVRGMDGNTLWYGSLTNPSDPTSFSGWNLLDGATNSAPALTSNGTIMCLVVRGLDNRIYCRTYNGSWGPWQAVQTGATCDSPAVAMLGNNLHIVVRGMDGSSLWDAIASCDGTVIRGWNELSGATPSKPVVICTGVYSQCLIVRGMDNTTYYNSYAGSTDSWADWNAVPTGTTIDAPAATIMGNTLWIVVRGSDGNTLWIGEINLEANSFLGWSLISGATSSAPTLTS